MDNCLALLLMFDDLRRLVNGFQCDTDISVQLLQHIMCIKRESTILRRERARFEELYISGCKENVELRSRLKNAGDLIHNEALSRLKVEEEKNGFREQIEMISEFLAADKLGRDESHSVSRLADLIHTLQKDGVSRQDAGSSRLLPICSVSDQQMTPPRSSSVFSASPVATVENGSLKRRKSGSREGLSVKLAKPNDCENKPCFVTPVAMVHGTIAPQSRSEHPENEESSSWSSGAGDSNGVEDGDRGALASRTQLAPRDTSPALARTSTANPLPDGDRGHVFLSKTVLELSTCPTCRERIRFGQTGHWCENCGLTCHPECRTALALPCGRSEAPGSTMSCGTILDHVPPSHPFIPAVVLRTIAEVERRGLTQVGLYRVPSYKGEVAEIRGLFRRGQEDPDLRKYSVHSVCGALKDFLESLRDTLIPLCRWGQFVGSCNVRDPSSRRSGLGEAVLSLNSVNRETLALIILHLQRVVASPACRVSASDMAEAFSPALWGHDNNTDVESLPLQRTSPQPDAKVLTCLLCDLDPDFWREIVKSGEVILRSNQFSSVLGPLYVEDLFPTPS